PKILPGTEVIIHGKKKIKGVISSIPPHLQTGKRTKPWSMTEIFIDTGLNDLDLQANVRVGDYISLPKSFISLKNSRVAGASLDNRVGVSLLVDIAQSLNKVTDFTIVFAATFGEEIGLRGGITSSYRIKPDIGICLDVSFGDFPGQPNLLTKLGSGPILSIGPVYHSVFQNFIKKTAKRKKIKFQHEIENRPGGTNAGPIQLSGAGIAVAGISVPIRNMHSPVEVADLNDIKNTSKLIKEVISTLKISILEKVKCY
ncbi:M42 family peptidase, partial [Candidatus Dependentiae bacterium]|nr:M42 family peptidase [Candidatus Dependentiae bacterium]